METLNKSDTLISHTEHGRVDNRYIREVFISPVRGIQVENREEKFPEILTLTEIRKFLFKAKKQQHEWYPIWSMALITGMRSGELYALEWDDIDFENNLLRACFATQLLSDGVEMTKVMKIGGWRDIKTMEALSSQNHTKMLVLDCYQFKYFCISYVLYLSACNYYVHMKKVISYSIEKLIIFRYNTCRRLLWPKVYLRL